MNAARAANKYFNDEEPWKTIKSDPDKAAKTLFSCVQTVKALATYFSPIVPFSCEKIYKALGLKRSLGEANGGERGENYWRLAPYPELESGAKIEKPDIIFKRIEDKVVEEQTAKLGKADGEEDSISIEDFQKIKLRTVRILEAEKVKKSKKLLKLIADVGGEKRQILAGVAQYYKPEELVGKTLVAVTNLKPAKLMGLESQGMILAASDEKGALCFVVPERDDIGPGAEVR